MRHLSALEEYCEVQGVEGLGDLPYGEGHTMELSQPSAETSAESTRPERECVEGQTAIDEEKIRGNMAKLTSESAYKGYYSTLAEMNANDPIYEVFSADIVVACRAYHMAYLESREAQEPPAYRYWLTYISDPCRQQAAIQTPNAQNSITLSPEVFNTLVARSGTVATATAINGPHGWDPSRRPSHQYSPACSGGKRWDKPRYRKDDRQPYVRGQAMEQHVPEYRCDRHERGGRGGQKRGGRMAGAGPAATDSPEVEMLAVEGIGAGLPNMEGGLSTLDLQALLGDLPGLEGGGAPGTLGVSDMGTDDWGLPTDPASPKTTESTVPVSNRLTMYGGMGQVAISTTSKQVGTATTGGSGKEKGRIRLNKVIKTSKGNTTGDSGSCGAREGKCQAVKPPGT
ncbi:hypothetical protein FRC06_005966 [Ceratobasidium sp. 370]|nr:hypothetical protein FRC06_005966 [Ceratobasidium sp. 370]